MTEGGDGEGRGARYPFLGFAPRRERADNPHLDHDKLSARG
jgi:hypothetical protein